MADPKVLEPQVLNLHDRGICAIDYIDYFDEGMYGPDKVHFVSRYRNLKDIAAQMDKCLSLQTPVDEYKSLIHLNRLHIDGKWVEPLQNQEEKWPQRAQYAIQFKLRIRFYGDFGYVDIGAKWTPDYEKAAEEGNLMVKAEDLKVVNSCWLSNKDANLILDELRKHLTYDGNQKYDPSTASLIALSEKELAARKEAEAEAAAVYLTDGDLALGDANGLLNLA